MKSKYLFRRYNIRVVKNRKSFQIDTCYAFSGITENNKIESTYTWSLFWDSSIFNVGWTFFFRRNKSLKLSLNSLYKIHWYRAYFLRCSIYTYILKRRIFFSLDLFGIYVYKYTMCGENYSTIETSQSSPVRFADWRVKWYLHRLFYVRYGCQPLLNYV